MVSLMSLSFVDRDMLMHHYFGMGVGHAYTFDMSTQQEQLESTKEIDEEPTTVDRNQTHSEEAERMAHDDDTNMVQDVELGDTDESDREGEDASDDEVFYAEHEMYG